MDVFFPKDIFSLYLILLLIAFIVGPGYLITRIKKYVTAIFAAWSLVVLGVAASLYVLNSEHPGFRMVGIIIVTLFSMKVVVTVETYKGSKRGLTFLQWMAFSTGWFGMRPHLFETLGQPALQGARPLIVSGIIRILLGMSILVTIHYLGISSFTRSVKFLLTGMLLAGISLILHFGILNVSAGMWRLSGVNTTTLFRSPFLSTSLTEFWGRRWNLAFSEMTAVAIYRPLKTSLGIATATVLAFIFSGLLHEIAISVPVMSGLGLPLIYFLIHGLLMLFEKFLDRKGLSISKNKWLGRAWVMFWLIFPMPILFHEQFIRQIVWPLVQ